MLLKTYSIFWNIPFLIGIFGIAGISFQQKTGAAVGTVPVFNTPRDRLGAGHRGQGAPGGAPGRLSCAAFHSVLLRSNAGIKNESMFRELKPRCLVRLSGCIKSSSMSRGISKPFSARRVGQSPVAPGPLRTLAPYNPGPRASRLWRLAPCGLDIIVLAVLHRVRSNPHGDGVPRMAFVVPLDGVLPGVRLRPGEFQREITLAREDNCNNRRLPRRSQGQGPSLWRKPGSPR